ncbi:GNAT family N-acetyltransferase [Desulfosporosinus orientis]|uniref:GNAT family N-acetyltransferase n=1 Tax=Desulfosporosinus orientis TaxID=1563 RepID=UPI001FA704C9|nr:GNAT family N-acetyltransferase [Desulfosporosinus orientis]
MNEIWIKKLPSVEFRTVPSNCLEALKQIVNSNKEYNILSEGHAELTDAEILEMYESSKRVGAVMSYIMHNGSPIGVIDYLSENPSDKMPWLGLLMIHTKNQGKGYAIAALERYEFLMKTKGLKKVRLGVIKGNERALRFWNNRGFTFYQEKQGDKWTIMCFEKEL